LLESRRQRQTYSTEVIFSLTGGHRVFQRKHLIC